MEATSRDALAELVERKNYFADEDLPIHQSVQDRQLLVEFFIEAKPSPYQSSLQGKPVWEDEEMVRITIPGDVKLTVVAKADDHYKRRFSEQYQAFRNDTKYREMGTPLEHWKMITKSQLSALMHANIFTVEQLASTADSLAPISGFQALKQQAKQWLEETDKARLEARIHESTEQKLRERDAEVEALNDRIAAMEKFISQIQPLEDDIDSPSEEGATARTKNKSKSV